MFYDFVKALKPHFHLTLFNLGNPADADRSLFDEVVAIPSANGIPDPTSLLRNDFQLLYYPDIGLGDESIFLANLRLAPIQIATASHPFSTFGAEIDYFISGGDVEPSDSPERHYSERLVLLPGMGCTHRPPPFPRPAAAAEPPADLIVINCAWTGPKINFPFLKSIAGLINDCRRPLRLRIFEGGTTLHKNDFIPFLDAISALLPPGKFQVVVNLPYDQYMAELQKAHFALDAFPFGGCNTIADSLYLGIPVLCREGDQRHNRTGPHMLRLAGVPELAVNSAGEYLEAADRLIHNDAFRQSLRGRLQRVPLAETLYDNSDAAYFKEAFDMLISQHATLQRDASRIPIRIPRV